MKENVAEAKDESHQIVKLWLTLRRSELIINYAFDLATLSFCRPVESAPDPFERKNHSSSIQLFQHTHRPTHKAPTLKFN